MIQDESEDDHSPSINSDKETLLERKPNLNRTTFQSDNKSLPQRYIDKISFETQPKMEFFDFTIGTLNYEIMTGKTLNQY